MATSYIENVKNHFQMKQSQQSLMTDLDPCPEQVGTCMIPELSCSDSNDDDIELHVLGCRFTY